MVNKIEDQTVSIDKAEKVLNDLQAKHSRLVARGVEIGDERANIAYQAHATGDAKAEKRPAELNREAAEHASGLASLLRLRPPLRSWRRRAKPKRKRPIVPRRSCSRRANGSAHRQW
jgi:hypothetical protein